MATSEKAAPLETEVTLQRFRRAPGKYFRILKEIPDFLEELLLSSDDWKDQGPEHHVSIQVLF